MGVIPVQAEGAILPSSRDGQVLTQPWTPPSGRWSDGRGRSSFQYKPKARYWNPGVMVKGLQSPGLQRQALE
jgi:hypothetical protein